MISFDHSQIFLVTGTISGIGQAMILGGTVICAANDLDDLPRWMRSLCKEYGRFKGMVLCAGIQQIIPLAALSITQAKELFDINFFAGLSLCKGFCDRRVNMGKGSSIVLISSIASITGNSGIVAYSASKGAMNALKKRVNMKSGIYLEGGQSCENVWV